MAFFHGKIRDVGAAYLGGGGDLQMAQEVRINLMALVRHAHGRLGDEGFDAHDAHEAADPFASYIPTMGDEFEPELARPKERSLRVELVEGFHDLMVFAGGFDFARGEAVAVDSDELALPAHGELGVMGFDHGLSLRSIPSCSHFFRGIPFQ